MKVKELMALLATHDPEAEIFQSQNDIRDMGLDPLVPFVWPEPSWVANPDPLDSATEPFEIGFDANNQEPTETDGWQNIRKAFVISADNEGE